MGNVKVVVTDGSKTFRFSISTREQASAFCDGFNLGARHSQDALAEVEVEVADQGVEVKCLDCRFPFRHEGDGNPHLKCTNCCPGCVRPVPHE